jgi:uncharacterized membrane protein
MPPLVVAHLAAALPALAVGLWVLARPKGTAPHRRAGWTYLVLMAATALTSFGILELRDGAGPSAVHVLSVVTLASLVGGVWAARSGRVRAHKRFMLGTFVGIVAAGAAAMIPGRMVPALLFG